MGTIVLSPQDCFSSHNYRQSYYFPSATMPETGRKHSRALMVPLPAAEDCARHDHSGGSPPGDGLLPIPQPHGQARALSKKPTSPSKPSSIFCTPRAGRTPASTASFSPSVKKLSRSASAILPTPLVGSPPGGENDVLNLLKGRLPFKIVQGNGPGINKSDVVQRNNSRKPNEARIGASKKNPTMNGHATNVKVKGVLQGSRPSGKMPNDGAFLKGQPKKVDEKNDRSLQRSHSVKGPGEKCDQNDGIPVVTILQRPQSKEAATELLTKFLQKSAEQEVVCVDERSANCIAEDLRGHSEIIKESEIVQQKSRDVLSDSESNKDGSARPVFSPCQAIDVMGAVASKYLLTSPTADAAKLAVSPTPGFQVSFNPSRGTLGDVCEELAAWERWAGPCYINSPPPSALPLPRFSRRQLRIESIATPGLFEEIISERASTPPPSSISPLYACLSDRDQLGGLNSDAVMTATKDLKRILNLDLCRM